MRPTWLPAVILLLATAAANAAPVAPVVRNGNEPAHGLRTITLQEQWRIGGLDDEENLLGLVRDAQMDAEGNLYLTDSQLVTVLVYDSEGNFIAELGREGDGPGEFHRPSGAILLPDGTVGVTQSFPGSIIKIGRDGTPAGRIELGGDPTEGGFFALRRVMPAGDGLVYSGTDMTREESRMTLRLRLVRCDLQGREQSVYFERTDERDRATKRRDEADNFLPDVWTVGPDGRVWFPPFRNEYRINVYAPDGRLERTITREFESWRRTPEEIEFTKMWMTPTRGRRQWEIAVAETSADFTRMRVAEDGRLWVLSSRGAHPQKDGIHSVWDVFDAEGHFDEQIALACEGVALNDAILFPEERTVVVVRNSLDAARAARAQSLDEPADEEAEPIEVIVYRMPEN